jgi:uncharacterized protein YbjT (DUF2867 family)
MIIGCDFMNNKILVTGATGTIGSRVLRKLAEHHESVRAAMHTKGEVAGSSDVVRMDYNVQETLRAALRDVDKVFFVTPLEENMVEMTERFVEEAGRAGVNHIVKLSVLGATMHTLLGMMHRESERVIEDSGIAYTFVRPNFFMQNYFGMASTIKTKGEFYAPMADAKISAVDAGDVAAVAVAALLEHDHEGYTYEVTGSEAFTNHDAAKVFSNVLGKKIAFINITDDHAHDAMKGSGLGDWTSKALMELYATARGNHMASISKSVEHATGRKPKTFTDFVRENRGVFA